MRLHATGGIGPFREVLMGEMAIEDMRHFDHRRITSEVIDGMYSDRELDRKYRGKDIVPIIVVVHHRGTGYGAGMYAHSAFDRVCDGSCDSLRRQNANLREQLNRPLTPAECFKITPETNQNLLLL